MGKVDIHQKEYLDFKSIFMIFSKENRLRTITIILISLMIGVFYILIKTPVYRTDISLEVDALNETNRGGRANDIISNIKESAVMDVETEMDVIKSRFLLSKAIDSASLQIKYYKKDLFKKKEFYKKLPITIQNINIKNKKFYDKTFKVTILDNKRFKFSIVESPLKPIFDILKNTNENFSKYNGIYTFGQKIDNKDFSFKIQKM